MKINLFPLGVFCVILFMSSCQIIPQNKGKLVVTNQSEPAFLFFTHVWTREVDTNEWLLQWHKDTIDIADNTDAALYLTPGKYDIRVRVEGLLTYKEFETGYKHPIRVLEIVKELRNEALNEAAFCMMLNKERYETFFANTFSRQKYTR